MKIKYSSMMAMKGDVELIKYGLLDIICFKVCVNGYKWRKRATEHDSLIDFISIIHCSPLVRITD